MITTAPEKTNITQYSIDAHLRGMGLDPVEETYNRLREAILPLIPKVIARGAIYHKRGRWVVVSHDAKWVGLSLGLRDGLTVIEVEAYGVNGLQSHSLNLSDMMRSIRVHPVHLDIVLCHLLDLES